MIPVDVIIPIHGDGAFLDQTLESVERQTYLGKIRVICALDRVEDSVLTKLELWKKRLDIFVIESGKPGISNALNRAIDISDAEFIFRLDADDLMEQSRIEDQLRVMISQNLGILGSNATLINQYGKEFSKLQMPTTYDAVRSTLEYANPFVHSSVCLKRNVLGQHLRYRNFYEPAEDFDLWLRILEQHKGQNLSTYSTRYRVHQGQVSVNNRKRQIIAREACLRSARLRGLSEVELDKSFESLETWYHNRVFGPSFFTRYQVSIEARFRNRTSGLRSGWIVFGLLTAIINPKIFFKRLRLFFVSHLRSHSFL
jgi:glycosyltransferase involved in cell wall biosynthesis